MASTAFSKYKAATGAPNVTAPQPVGGQPVPLPKLIPDPKPFVKKQAAQQPATGGGLFGPDWKNQGGGGEKYWINQLKTPVTLDIGRSAQELQRIYNLQRAQTQGATNAAAEELATQMRGLGFDPGESGIGDTAVGQILSKGQESLAQNALATSLDEVNRRFTENATLAQLNQQRLASGGDLASKLRANQIATAQLDINRGMLGVARSQAGNAAAALAFEKERFAKEFGLAEQKFGLETQQQKFYEGQTGFMNTFNTKQQAIDAGMDYMKILLGSQQQQQDPYKQSLINTFGS